MKLLLQRLYGPRSERYHPDQGLLFLDFVLDANAADDDKLVTILRVIHAARLIHASFFNRSWD